jgi:hypothetical protein
MVRNKWEKVGAVATRQHQCIARWQLRCLDVSDTEIAERVRRHGWTRKGNGVIAVPGEDTLYRTLAIAVLAYSRPANAAARVQERLTARESLVDAVVEAALGAGQFITADSALWLHGVGRKPSTHTLRLAHKTSVAARKGVALRLGAVTGTPTRVHGLPVVDVEQAVVDVAGDDARAGLELHHHLTKMIATADRKRLTTLDALGRRVDAGRFLGKPALRRALADLRGELSHSATEAKARATVARVLAKYGLALEPRPHAIKVAGQTVGEADLAVVAITLDIEIDGPHHLLPEQVRADQRRDRRVRRASWEVERFSTELVDLRPVTFAAQVDECVRFRLGLA